MADGIGIYINGDGTKYFGEWKNDQKNGLGVETWLDGSFY
jgi:hypothetical protein